MDRALYWNLPASLVFTTLLVYVGLVLFARYGDNDPVGCVIHRRDQVKCSSFCLCLYSPIMCAKLNGSLNEQKSNNLLSLMKIERNKIVLIWCLLRHTCTHKYILFQMIPWFVMDVLGDYAGFPGLMVACIFSASLRWELTLIIRFKIVHVRIGHHCPLISCRKRRRDGTGLSDEIVKSPCLVSRQVWFILQPL